MRYFTPKTNAIRQTTSAGASILGQTHLGQSRGVNTIPHLQRTIGNQSVERMLPTYAVKPRGELTDMAPPRLGHDFSQIPIHPQAEGVLQAKFAINKPKDQHEQEADRISEQVMRMEAPEIAHTGTPAIQRINAGFQEKVGAKHRQRLCPECEEEGLQRKSAPMGAGAGTQQAKGSAEMKVNAVSGGKPLTEAQRAFFEPRFGADFSRVRIQTGNSADAAARSIGAYAYTRGSDVVFREDQYRPDTFAGRRLLAHELTHVVQQGAVPRIQRPLNIAMASQMVQRWPGDGMTRPGDCSWGTYIALRGSVETAKAVVSMLGACEIGDSCLLLATKIAAVTAEIAARVAVATACFRGGDTNHRGQVQEKINMMNRCYRFFSRSNCPPALIEAMAAVVERAREVIAAAAVVVAVALVAALVAAIIALAEVIAALLVAAAESAAVAAVAAAVIALLVTIRDEVSSA